MAILQAIVGFIGRSLGKILNTVFGWATIMLFGKVPSNRQIYLTIMAFGSVLWLIALIGTVFPSAGTFLIAFMPLPSWVDQSLVRLAMLAAAIILPPVMGLMSLLVVDPEDRPKGATGKAKRIVRGYTLTPGLAATLIMLTIFAPIMKVQAVSRRWIVQHMPIIVEPEDYGTVIEDIQRVLKEAGWDTQRGPASWMIRFPTKVVTLLAGGGMKNLVAEQLTTLRSKTLEVALHPADLVIQGQKDDVAHAREAIVERLAFSKAYMTWDKDANELEDRIYEVSNDLKGDVDAADRQQASEKLRAIERDLKDAKIPFEEWEVLFREKLLVERHLLEETAGAVGERGSRAAALHDGNGATRGRADTRVALFAPAMLMAVLLVAATFAWRSTHSHH